MTGPVLAVDGNSLVHRGYHALAHTGTRSLDGEPAWAVRGLLMQLVDAVDRLGPSRVVVGFDDPERSLRREAHPAYKAQRPDKLRTLVSQLELAASLLRGLGVQVVVPEGLEADDVLASVAARGLATGCHTVLVTSDRDAFALISPGTSVLRIINGGVGASPLLTPDRLELMLGVRPEQYLDFAALRGDPSDNLPGVRGIGPKSAARLLTAFGTARAVFDDVDAGGAGVREACGPAAVARLADPEARAAWERNCGVMTFHDDLDVSPDGDVGRLPLDQVGVRRAYLRFRLPGTQSRALRVLSGVEPSGPALSDAVPEDTLAWDPTAEWRSRRAFPPLLSEQRDPQLTLF